jgi:predicted nucleotidyltransferase
MERRLADSSETADQLRAEARELLVNAVADAHQLGMTQREISAGLRRSQPEVSRLLKLAAPRFLPKTDLGRKVVEHRHLILQEVEKAGASNVRVFGSVARGEDGPDSDVDLLIEIPDGFTLFDLGRLQVAVERVLGHAADVIPDRGLKGKIRSRAFEDAVAL